MADRDALIDLFAEEALIDREKLDLDKTLEDIGVDSVDMVNVIFAFEEKYKVIIETDELSRDMKLGQMLDLALRKIEAQAAAQ